MTLTIATTTAAPMLRVAIATATAAISPKVMSARPEGLKCPSPRARDGQREKEVIRQPGRDAERREGFVPQKPVVGKPTQRHQQRNGK